MKKRRFLCSVAVSLIITTMVNPIAAMAEEGWVRENESWRYLDSQNNVVTDSWKVSDDNWHYLNIDGHMAENRFLVINDSVFYVDEAGRRLSNQWIFAEEDFGDNGSYLKGWYYFGDNGKAFKAVERRFKKTIDGKTYAFDDMGRMLTGFLNEDGQVIEEESEVPSQMMYFAKADGSLLQNEWLDYMAYSETQSPIDMFSQATGRNYEEYKEIWFYFDSDTKKFISKSDKLRQKTIDGTTYGFDENGVMNQWWGKVATVSNADKSNPSSSTSARYYSGYDGGQLFKNKWFWMYPSENLDPDEYDAEECSWWHTDGNGEVYRDAIKKIGTGSYAFDGLGRMRTGFVLFDKKSEFVAQYDVDTWDSTSFIDGSIYGIEKADLYLFSPDEINDGSMQSGNEIEIQLEDGTHTFGFGANGKAFGNRNQLQKRNDMYYINGLRLDADEEFGYGVVMADEADGHYQVVNTNGKIVEGKKKLVKEGNDGYLVILNNRFMAYVTDEFKPIWRTGEEGTGYYHYDKNNKENPYARGLIAGYDTEAISDGLSSEQKLNF